MKIFSIIIGIIVLGVLVSSILHATYFKNKMERIQPYGELVEVFDGKIHVTQLGSGEKTIVLLPGLGTVLPSADFAPLMRELSKNYHVVCIEYFGMGFSSETERTRTCENYVEEIRVALKAAGVDTPYVLMPHSISGVYSEYYASSYPEEVEAIVSLDGTSSAYIGEDMPAIVKSLIGVAKGQQAIGLNSILAPVTVNKKKLMSYGYTEKEISDLIAYAGFSMNDNSLEQMVSTTEHIKAANELTYPKEEVPYYKIISKQTYETSNPQIKITPQEYQMKHLERVGATERYEILEGSHYIYQNNVEKTTELVTEFLDSLN